VAPESLVEPGVAGDALPVIAVLHRPVVHGERGVRREAESVSDALDAHRCRRLGGELLDVDLAVRSLVCDLVPQPAAAVERRRQLRVAHGRAPGGARLVRHAPTCDRNVLGVDAAQLTNHLVALWCGTAEGRDLDRLVLGVVRHLVGHGRHRPSVRGLLSQSVAPLGFSGAVDAAVAVHVAQVILLRSLREWFRESCRFFAFSRHLLTDPAVRAQG